MKYEYISPQDEQYDNYSFKEGVFVPARYKKSPNAFDNGNPYVEALPSPRTGKETLQAYTFVPQDLENKVKTDSYSDALLRLSLLRQLRFPLPFHQSLEQECYLALINSYRARHALRDSAVNIRITTNDEESATTQVLAGNSADGTNAGFSLIGYSGCGKSCALKILFSNYPQVIMHMREDGTHFIQIVYLVVNCAPNSNFKALYQSVGHAIDQALGNTTPIYEAEIKKAAGLGGKAEVVRKLIELFGVGILVFDEIQLIDFESTRENSFEGLMTLANQTKVAMAVVGTEDAYHHMFKKLRTSRRLGTMIQGNSYCEDKDFFRILCKKLFAYQQFNPKKPVELSEELLDVLYDGTHGIVDQLIGIFMYMHIDYLNKKRKPEINEKYIRDVIHAHYSGIQKVNANLGNPLNDFERSRISNQANKEITAIIEKAKQKSFKKEIEEGFDDALKSKQVVDYVVSTISALSDNYNRSTIKSEIEKVLSRKGGTELSKEEVLRKVFEKLQKSHTDRRPARKKDKTELDDKHLMMKNFIEEYSGETKEEAEK